MLFIIILLSIWRAVLDIGFSWLIAFWFVNWWAPLFAVQTRYFDRGIERTGYKLPVWLAWFDTFDADLDQGVRDGTISGPSPYWNRVKWLYRNCGYGFSYWALGLEFMPKNWRVIKADATTFIAMGNGYFSLHIARFGIQVKFGWKVWNCYNRHTQQWDAAPWGPVWRVPFVFSISRA
ncbi:hypothetical protein [Herbaspirillum sp.]|uniref:DUF7338 family protein n=1 Tax=Herbaspirillum sp. TaxID=1890675 RepID=UPI001B2734CD|nr:hypothetical protein [Herbaspirillum sp.]MBO9538775.1 hypothetical protein [Herbaspirillum sp.]